MLTIVDIMLSIIEHPRGKKGYRDLSNYYQNLNMANEADAINELVKQLLTYDTNDPPIDSEQCDNIRGHAEIN